MENAKNFIFLIVGIVGSWFMTLLGGWDAGMTALGVMMAVDFVTGWIVAGVFKKSGKSANGSLESRAGFKGLMKKLVVILIILVTAQMDALVGVEFIRNAAVIAFSANEILSIIENAGLMGIPIPAVIVKAVDVLKNKAEQEDKTDE